MLLDQMDIHFSICTVKCFYPRVIVGFYDLILYKHCQCWLNNIYALGSYLINFMGRPLHCYWFCLYFICMLLIKDCWFPACNTLLLALMVRDPVRGPLDFTIYLSKIQKKYYRPKIIDIRVTTCNSDVVTSSHCFYLFLQILYNQVTSKFN